MDSDTNKIYTIKESAYICKYKLHSKLSETTIRAYIYRNIKANLLKAIYQNGHYLISEESLNIFIKENYTHLGFSYNPT